MPQPCRPRERAFDELIDAPFLAPGQAGGGALAFSQSPSSRRTSL